jgi:hypothetical protein
MNKETNNSQDIDALKLCYVQQGYINSSNPHSTLLYTVFSSLSLYPLIFFFFHFSERQSILISLNKLTNQISKSLLFSILTIYFFKALISSSAFKDSIAKIFLYSFFKNHIFENLCFPNGYVNSTFTLFFILKF